MIETQIIDATMGAYSLGNNGNGKTDIDKLFSTLTSREERIMRSRILDEMSLEAIGKSEACTRERIRQIEAKAIRKLKKAFHHTEEG